MPKGPSATRQELEAGRGYEALFVPALFKPWTKHLVNGAGVEDGCDVLDLACGSGVLARHALEEAGRSGRVVGIDPAPGMIAAAMEVEPDVEWILGRAEDLPFEDEAFDCVVSQFGMMFFDGRAKAEAEMHRVLKPGGRVAVAVWNSIDHNPAYREISAVLDEQVGTEAGRRVEAAIQSRRWRPVGQGVHGNRISGCSLRDKNRAGQLSQFPHHG